MCFLLLREELIGERRFGDGVASRVIDSSDLNFHCEEEHTRAGLRVRKK